jgi:hypothetical protein
MSKFKQKLENKKLRAKFDSLPAKQQAAINATAGALGAGALTYGAVKSQDLVTKLYDMGSPTGIKRFVGKAPTGQMSADQLRSLGKSVARRKSISNAVTQHHDNPLVKHHALLLGLGAAAATGVGLYGLHRHVQKKKDKESVKKASRHALIGAGIGAVTGGGLNTLKQLGAIRSERHGQKKVDPYRVGRAMLLGAGAGATVGLGVQHKDKVVGAAKGVKAYAKNMSDSAQRTMHNVENISHNTNTAAENIGRAADNIADTSATITDTTKNIGDTATAWTDVAHKMKNNRFLGITKKSANMTNEQWAKSLGKVLDIYDKGHDRGRQEALQHIDQVSNKMYGRGLADLTLEEKKELADHSSPGAGKALDDRFRKDVQSARRSKVRNNLLIGAGLGGVAGAGFTTGFSSEKPSISETLAGAGIGAVLGGGWGLYRGRAEGRRLNTAYEYIAPQLSNHFTG